MEAMIRVTGGDPVLEATDLHLWLRGERELTGLVGVVRKPPGATDLGGMIDAVVVALGSSGAGVALAQALKAWLRTRRPDVSITVKSDAGEVTLDAHNLVASDVLPILERVLRDRDA
ncbi:effector-associated constant component EACC1 [Sphaerisporangium aureirubrum]|uniref:Uncharacterized protein n=1 Tax=Sphaerisporangium aureirubrum TaxID=1544736 RepID=A0ABW1ND43_9ACTN